jgi:hypothetical protein
MRLHACLLLTASLPALRLPAQLPSIDITSVITAQNQVEVYIRPDGPFTEVFSSIAFTIRWLDADNSTLGDFIQTPPIFCGTSKSGPELVNGPYRYQVYAGFGFTQIINMGMSWSAGQEVLLGKLDIIGPGSAFQIVEDAFTASINGDFYVSLNGIPSTGVIYAGSTQLVDEQEGVGVMVMPNPSEGLFTVVPKEALPPGTVLRVEDTTGRTVREATVGAWPFTIDLSNAAPGAYLVSLHNGPAPFTCRIVRSGP